MKRMSMNTSLRNANIFEENSSDDEDNPKPIKIKAEPPEFDSCNDNTQDQSEFKVKTEVKLEKDDSIFSLISDTSLTNDVFNNIAIKSEIIKEFTSPMKSEPQEDETPSKISLKSVKITSYKARKSPYKRSVFDRIGEVSEQSEPKKKKGKIEMEMDSAILQRRQKQIDYGKNTRGYDNYRNTVPKAKRSQDDPQTPNKLYKYSRRGWDGLIRQWRLKLHKYDPTDD